MRTGVVRLSAVRAARRMDAGSFLGVHEDVKLRGDLAAADKAAGTARKRVITLQEKKLEAEERRRRLTASGELQDYYDSNPPPLDWQI